jgi:hypothetical protein
MSTERTSVDVATLYTLQVLPLTELYASLMATATPGPEWDALTARYRAVMVYPTGDPRVAYADKVAAVKQMRADLPAASKCVPDIRWVNDRLASANEPDLVAQSFQIVSRVGTQFRWAQQRHPSITLTLVQAAAYISQQVLIAHQQQTPHTVNLGPIVRALEELRGSTSLDVQAVAACVSRHARRPLPFLLFAGLPASTAATIMSADAAYVHSLCVSISL